MVRRPGLGHRRSHSDTTILCQSDCASDGQLYYSHRLGMMTSSVMRNLPTLVLAITVALSLIYVWKTLNAIDGRVGRLEHELMCVLEVVNHMAVHPAEPEQREAEVDVHPESAVMADEASSVGEADVEIMNPAVSHEAAHPGKHELMQRFRTDVSSASREGEEDFLSLQKHLQGSRQPPPEGGGSETTDASALQSLSTRKRVPPYSASSDWLNLGDRVTHNGQEYEVIKTKNNILRWGRPRPHGPGDAAAAADQGTADNHVAEADHADDEHSPDDE